MPSLRPSVNQVWIEEYMIKTCKYCGKEIVWLQNRKGKSYPVNFGGLRAVSKIDFHNCNKRAIND